MIHHSFMRRTVVYPPIRRRPLFRGGGGVYLPYITHPETEHHFNSSRWACMRYTHANLHGTGDRTPPRPCLHWPHSKSYL
ncbi:Hypothetical protein FKW44_025045 [Caligus rogercresseyi]|uniref:Uncharacterized protein n=1 Tax=Caligus rogercresseyi TaxID=217165 RepID=A0A7T8JSD0_CALRO|nr:Hypothetical protein FKW44_025045 [Caligus rogercresseyi]